MRPRISLVVPAYNEERHLPALLESVAAARKRYQAGAQEVEVIVADNASTDATARIAREHGCQVVAVAERTIATVRNAGAAVARGTVVAFVDADSLVHPDTFDAIDRTLTDEVVVGATGIIMSRSSMGIDLSMFLANLITRLARVDSGVVFCRRSDWKAVGGYDETRRIAEDLGFLRDLKRLGRSRGQRFARAKGAVTITSARKFDRHGDWHMFTSSPHLLVLYLFDRRVYQRFVERYWYTRE
jgi:glycosyltransferase involved in cell wall biosynthesis